MDFVELQLRIAAGEKMPFKQDDVTFNGHAIELRINAEDATGGSFLPSPGTITAFTAPDGFGVRLDAGYQAGDTVSQYYDNLVGKLIVWAKERDTARRRALRAISETKIEGVATTLPAHEIILSTDEFTNATHATTWVESKVDFSPIKPPSVAAAVDENGEARVPRDVEVEVNGKHYSVKMFVPEAGPSIAARAEALLKKAQRKPAGSSSTPGNITVPMQGTVLRLLVKEGDSVEPGQTICVLEAMKMENNVNADVAGTIKDLKVKEGSTVGPGDMICSIVPKA
jgi:acetyl-CoA/propionyl-CoA carboxylase biotin carboxyl carrier protein